jgi:hypothetical protein
MTDVRNAADAPTVGPLSVGLSLLLIVVGSAHPCAHAVPTHPGKVLR